MKLAEALTRLQTLKRRRDLYKLLVDAANNGKQDRLFSRDVRTKDEVKQIIYPGLDINELRKIRDDFAEQAKLLDAQIQRTNWQKEIQEHEIQNQTLAEVLIEVKRLNENYSEKIDEVKHYIRVYEDEVDQAPNIEILLAGAIEILDQIERKKITLQRENWGVELI